MSSRAVKEALTEIEELEAETNRLEQDLNAARDRLRVAQSSSYATHHAAFELMAARLSPNAVVRRSERWPNNFRSVDWTAGDARYDLCVSWRLEGSETEVEASLDVTSPRLAPQRFAHRFVFKSSSLYLAVDGVFKQYEVFARTQQTSWRGRMREAQKMRISFRTGRGET